MFCFVWRGGDVCSKDFHFSVIGLKWTLWQFRIAKKLGKYTSISIIVRSLPTCAMMLQLALDQDAQGPSTQGQKKGATPVLGRTPFSEKQYIYLHLINL